MKTIELINGEWKVRTDLHITDEQTKILQSRPLWNEQRQALLRELSFYSQAEPDDAASAQAIFDKVKLDGEIISASVSLPDGSGIINCRVNGEYQQIRF
jgi:hypothetical protein